MKKVILTGVALMGFAAASFAQNNATLNQNGSSQTSSQNQTGNLLNSTINQTSTSGITNVGNYAKTTQGSPYVYITPSRNNDAFIDQIGTKSSFANIGQEGGTGGLNTARINQKNNNGGNGTVIGAGNEPSAQAPGNVPNTAGIAAVTGAGGNYANIYQQGGREQSTINQNDNSSGNYADSRQDNYNSGTSSQIVTIDQNNTSQNNKATANQFGDQNQLSISQSNNSSSNKADVRQGFSSAQGGPNTTGATAKVEQNGMLSGAASTGNDATILQRGTTASTTNATILQNAGMAGRSEMNVGSITQQNGEGGTATVNQSNWSYSNKADIQQQGQSIGVNTASIDQTRNSHDNRGFVVQQGGTGNSATISQEVEVANNDAFINQGVSGNNNIGSIKQTYAYGSSGNYSAGNGNIATINQNIGTSAFTVSTAGAGTQTVAASSATAGSNNKAYIEQGSASVMAGVATIANGNMATINQQNSDNEARLRQTGTNNQAGVLQLGNGNILQNGTAGSFAIQAGSGNAMVVLQNNISGSVPNIANVNQMGTNNTAMVNQSGN